MQSVESSPIHPLEHDDVAAGIGYRDRNCYSGLACLVDRGGRYPLRPLMGKTFCVGDITFEVRPLEY